MASRSSKRTLAIAMALAASVAVGAQAPSDRSRAEAASQRAADRIRALQRESDDLASQEKTLLVELRTLEVERELKTEQLLMIEREQRDAQRKLARAIARATSLREAAESERPKIEARLVQLYKLGRAGYWRVLLDVENLESIGRAYRTASAMSRLDRDRLQRHQETLDALAVERQVLENHVQQIAALQQQAISSRAAVNRAAAARTALIEAIDARRDLNAQLTSELESAQQKLQSALTQLAAGRPATAVALPLRPFRGALLSPSPGAVTGRFGRQRSSRFGTAITRNGIEISATDGQAVRAVHEGTVAYSDAFTGYGNLVIVDHGDGAYSLYGHLSSIDVARGSRVDAQQQVGTSGRTPAGNPAVYFELRVDGKPVDPLQWLKR